MKARSIPLLLLNTLRGALLMKLHTLTLQIALCYLLALLDIRCGQSWQRIWINCDLPDPWGPEATSKSQHFHQRPSQLLRGSSPAELPTSHTHRCSVFGSCAQSTLYRKVCLYSLFICKPKLCFKALCMAKTFLANHQICENSVDCRCVHFGASDCKSCLQIMWWNCPRLPVVSNCVRCIGWGGQSRPIWQSFEIEFTWTGFS